RAVILRTPQIGAEVAIDAAAEHRRERPRAAADIQQHASRVDARAFEGTDDLVVGEPVELPHRPLAGPRASEGGRHVRRHSSTCSPASTRAVTSPPATSSEAFPVARDSVTRAPTTPAGAANRASRPGSAWKRSKAPRAPSGRTDQPAVT